MASAKIRESLNIPQLLGDARAISVRSGDPASIMVAKVHTTSPLRGLLEKGSPSDFMTQLQLSLRNDGLSAERATGLLAEVVNVPSVAARHTLSTIPRSVNILQAVITRPFDDMPSILALLCATVESTKPPRVTKATIDLSPIALDDPANLVEIVAMAQRWWTEYRVREITRGPGDLPGSLGWLGDPSKAYRDVGPNWQSAVRSLGAVMGMNVTILRSAAEARSQNAYYDLQLAMAIRGVSAVGPLTGEAAGRRIPVVEIGTPGASVSDLIADASMELVLRWLSLQTVPARTTRELKPGESVYHRKVGAGGGDHDSFDDGSPAPCMHGAESYIRFGSAEKARKGMRRRYSNFEDSMLYHCAKFPNCHVYCVRGPVA